jgi:hypothetical protein
VRNVEKIRSAQNGINAELAENAEKKNPARLRLRPLEKGARRREKEPDSGLIPSPFSLLPSPAVQKT